MTAEVKVKRISPSQLEGFHRCNRRWAFEYRAGRREGFNSAAQAGTETHAVLENQGPWDKTWTSPEGKEYNVGEMAALLHAQTPDGVVAREHRFEVELDGVPFVGVTDFFTEELVGDFKTTSNKRNAKTIGGKDESKDLLIDPQRLLYTRFVPTAKRMIWLYGAWADMSVTKREVPVDVEKDKERFKLRVLQPAETMLNTPYDVDPLSLKPNVKACVLFPPKGCPFKDECFPPGKLSPIVTNSKESQIQMSSLLERLKAKNAATETAPAPEPVKLPEPPAAVKVALDEAREATTAMSGSNSAARGDVAPIAPVAQSVQQPTSSQQTDDKQYIVEFLYVDCLPLTLPFENAFVYISKAAETAEADLQVPHYGLVDFGRGAPAVAAQLRADLSGKRIQALYVGTKTPEEKACLAILQSVSRHVIRGVF